MNLIRITTLACAALGLTCSYSALAAEKEHEGGKVMAADKAWAHMAAVSDKVEITLAKAASEKSQSPEVKQHAQQMITDHTATTEQLTKWASANHVELNASLPPEKQAVVKEIESKSGAEFDKAYMMHEVETHRHAAVHFQNGVEFVMNPELKQFAQQNQPTINQHLSMTEQQAGAQRTMIAGQGQGGHEAMPHARSSGGAGQAGAAGSGGNSVGGSSTGSSAGQVQAK